MEAIGYGATCSQQEYMISAICYFIINTTGNLTPQQANDVALHTMAMVGSPSDKLKAIQIGGK